MTRRRHKMFGAGLAGLALALFLSAGVTPGESGDGAPAQRVIVQGSDLDSVVEAVAATGARITHRLGIIRAVAAEVTNEQLERLQRAGNGLRVMVDREVRSSGKGGGGKAEGKEEYPPPDFSDDLIGSERLHAEGITGAGITIAVVDSGFLSTLDLYRTANGHHRLLAQYDARFDREVASGDPKGRTDDKNGHGTHMASVILSSRVKTDGAYMGVAPNADLVSIKALERDGYGTYADVIRGIDFAVTYKDAYGIRVLNLSLSAEARSHYWDDPLNQAVMRAWEAGIVVVTSSGNTGRDPMTIGVPGNNPYAITVGAVSDAYSPSQGTDDFLTSFSSVGPTVEGFVKPEVVAPGGHILGMMHPRNEIAEKHAEYHDGGDQFVMSGTSQAAAMTSGAVALLLEAQPWLTPDDVKCRLMATARPAVESDGSLAYSVFEQGAGLINVYDAVNDSTVGCANRGLDVTLDLLGLAHYGGLANQLPTGEYFVTGLAGYEWDPNDPRGAGYMWSDGYLWSDGYMWSDGFLWSDGYLWSDGFLWSDGYLWSDSLTESMSVNGWVDQE